MMTPALVPSNPLFGLVLALPGTWHLLTKGSECSVDVASASAIDDDEIGTATPRGKAVKRIGFVI